MRPELIVPLLHTSSGKHETTEGSVLTIGSTVRALRNPLFGKIGTVCGLPAEPQQIPTGAVVRVAEVEIDATVHQIPRANLEIVMVS